MNTDPEIQQELDKMADYIEEHGWCQGHERLDTGEVCLAGAWHRTVHYDTLGDKQYDRLANELHRRTRGGSRSRRFVSVGDTLFWRVPWWNDYPCRTKDDVIRMLRGKDLDE